MISQGNEWPLEGSKARIEPGQSPAFDYVG
jgi:hypothetical protein